MHELAIAQSIADVVQARATACHATRVTAIRLRIGEATAVNVESLAMCFQMLGELDPLLAGTALAAEVVPHRARCAHCHETFAVVNYVAQCPLCGAWSGDIVSGTELQILDMEIQTEREAEQVR